MSPKLAIHTYVLNLPEAKERLLATLSETKRVGLENVKIWEAWHPEKYAIPYDLVKNGVDFSKRPNPNTFACKKNFIRLLEHVASLHHEGVLFFLEDDVEFCFENMDSLVYYMQFLPEDFLIFNLGAYHIKKPIIYHEHIHKMVEYWLFHAVMINIPQIPILLRELNKNKNLLVDGDRIMGSIFFCSLTKQYSPNKMLAKQKIVQSQMTYLVEDKHQPK